MRSRFVFGTGIPPEEPDDTAQNSRERIYMDDQIDEWRDDPRSQQEPDDTPLPLQDH